MLDTSYSIETPEGIDLTLRPAGPVSRIMAYAIDTAIRWGLLIAVSMGVGAAGEFGMGMVLILYFLLEWFYPVYFEVYRQGMTPGKKSMGLRVVNDDGTPVSWDGSLVRNLLRVADFLPFFYLAGLVSMSVSGKFRRLGDMAAGTLVVHNVEATVRNTQNDVGSRAVAITFDSEEQRALIDFSEARDRLSKQRQAELANILEPLTGRQGEEGVIEVTRIANSLTGRE